MNDIDKFDNYFIIGCNIILLLVSVFIIITICLIGSKVDKIEKLLSTEVVLDEPENQSTSSEMVKIYVIGNSVDSCSIQQLNCLNQIK